MSIEEKEEILRKALIDIEGIEETDRNSIIAYIQGTRDTRERIKSESYSKS